jgi:hypothetical protein
MGAGAFAIPGLLQNDLQDYFLWRGGLLLTGTVVIDTDQILSTLFSTSI